ncbi:MAG: cbb3-type cytochrome c oxidase subunit 3 [Pseudomonadota bacterium]
MDTYSILREFADSWFLIGMFAFFLGACIFAFWPSLRSAREDAANIPLRDDDTAACSGDCDACACNVDFVKGQADG